MLILTRYFLYFNPFNGNSYFQYQQHSCIKVYRSSAFSAQYNKNIFNIYESLKLQKPTD